RAVRLTRMHLEEDTGKLTHLGSCSAVDLNRAGVPLLEIVTEPDLHSPDEAYAFLTALKQTLQYAGVSTCDMEKGQMRCDVNISVRPVGQERLGDKVEIKNLNSFRAVHLALQHEIRRQVDAVRAGARVRQETRGWDDVAGETVPQRSKEDAHDYRYFPEPDLMPLDISAAWAAAIAAALPEPPPRRRQRFVAQFGISEYDAAMLTAERATADYFEAAAASGRHPKTVANWVITELAGALAQAGLGIEQSPVAPTALGELTGLIDDGTISGRIAKDVFAEMLRTGAGAAAIVEARGLRQVSDEGAIDGFVRQAIEAHPAAVAEYRGGQAKALQFLVGQVMKISRGKANPRLAVQALTRCLDGGAEAPRGPEDGR
ncbi:MAG: Asp-tRNA(Asn)/Glu-tRNA(Gln) amidotransferase subunit GatB, partial [Lentisphaerae bacterium]|nr:Asp-tRNA(Asn)/Glu-tRNA(Gln) amidotransferase subunit GatB [Lentisphaerota bacterium]